VDVALLLARLGLAAVFVTAAIAKLLGPAGARQAVIDFGLPVSAARTVASVLPLVELVAAALVLWDGSARAGAVLAVLLLSAFSAAIVASLSKGRRPNCHCFGQVHSAPVGTTTLVRNAALAAVAAWVAWHGPGAGLGQAGSWAARHGEVVVAVGALILVVIQGRFVVQLLKQQGRLLLRIEALEESTAPAPAGLPVGTIAPDFVLPTLSGEQRGLDALLGLGHPVALVFISPTCGPCQALLPDLARWRTDLGERVTVVAITDHRPAVDDEDALATPVLALLDENDVVARTYRVGGTPSAVLVNGDRVVAAPLAGGAAAVRDLVEEAARAEASRATRPPLDRHHPAHDHNPIRTYA
jgi:uncharacterized membrane protein YphA (DoxX/SURF4 family)/thiol-disulfide isomerase/thioredoxin